VLHRELDFAVMFLTYVLTRNQRYESDLVDRFFSSSEKRLARILLLLAHFGEGGKLEAVIPRISQEALAEMVGTTRSRVGFFINKFRAQGFVGYDNRNQLQVHSSLRNVLRDTPGTISALVQP
jgi:CRP-like cAMP-binding protein